MEGPVPLVAKRFVAPVALEQEENGRRLERLPWPDAGTPPYWLTSFLGTSRLQ